MKKLTTTANKTKQEIAKAPTLIAVATPAKRFAKRIEHTEILPICVETGRIRFHNGPKKNERARIKAAM